MWVDRRKKGRKTQNHQVPQYRILWSSTAAQRQHLVSEWNIEYQCLKPPLTVPAVTAKSFTCYPQLTRLPAVCHTIAASPALSGTINLPSPFSPITDQLIDPLQLKTFPSFLCTHNQTRKWKGSLIICRGRVERPRLPFCKLVTSTTWRYHLKCWDLCHEGSCLSVLKSHFKSTSSCLSEVVSSKAGVFIVHSPVNLLPSLCWSLLYCLSFFSPPLAEHDNTTTMHEDLKFRWQYTS